MTLQELGLEIKNLRKLSKYSQDEMENFSGITKEPYLK